MFTNLDTMSAEDLTNMYLEVLYQLPNKRTAQLQPHLTSV